MHEKTVNSCCPKDCKYISYLSFGAGRRRLPYCNFGEIAHQEGKIKGYIRGCPVEMCTYYESNGGKKLKKDIYGRYML